jgi:signal peptidase I
VATMTEDHQAGEAATGVASSPAPRPVKRRRQRSSTRNALEWLIVIVAAVVIALLIKTFVVQAFRIPSDSMVDTLVQGDRVLVNKLSYGAHDINRGDVIVFSRPPGLPASPSDPEELIKRVIGLAGETVTTRDGTIYIDDRQLTEPYLSDGMGTYNLDAPLEVPDEHVLVLGDNRTNSTDGRSFGPIHVDSVVGRAFMIMWPPGRIGAL